MLSERRKNKNQHAVVVTVSSCSFCARLDSVLVHLWDWLGDGGYQQLNDVLGLGLGDLLDLLQLALDILVSLLL